MFCSPAVEIKQQNIKSFTLKAGSTVQQQQTDMQTLKIQMQHQQKTTENTIQTLDSQIQVCVLKGSNTNTMHHQLYQTDFILTGTAEVPSPAHVETWS